MAFTTNRTLLQMVRAGDEISWSEFYRIYQKLIRLRGTDFGLRDSENDELVQQVMLEIFNKDILGKYNFDKVPDNVTFHYDPAKGRFRHYFKAIVTRQAFMILRKRRPTEELSDYSIESDLLEARWDEEWQQHVMKQAQQELKNRVEPKTYQAFEMYALQNKPAQEVADFLECSVSSVYTAKSRCLTILQQVVREMNVL